MAEPINPNMSFEQNLASLMAAIYGETVRSTIHDALIQAFNNGGGGGGGGGNIKAMTQEEYDALSPKDPNTLYVIKPN